MNNISDFWKFFDIDLPGIDPVAIDKQWQALGDVHDIRSRRPPIPIWARRPYSHTGYQAWQSIQHELSLSNLDKAICLYVHIPFCAEKCTFCDCYSFPVRRHKDEVFRSYVEALKKEISLWSKIENLNNRPISTVHFGGGTPLCLGPDLLIQLVEAIQIAFPNHKRTEWALETNTSSLGVEINDVLLERNFTRVHIGVQTLHDPIRKNLQRHESGQTVIEKIYPLIKAGQVVSVDLIYGLPQQTLSSFLSDICILAENGIDGFSLYPLQISSRNRKILEAYGPSGKDMLIEYWMLQAAEQLLNKLGYRKTLFNHYAREKDTNLYFTFPERGEDCLALGTIADGVFGNYHYRHLEFREYIQQVSQNFPALQGGLLRSVDENRIFPLETEILSGSLRKDIFSSILGDNITSKLFDYWNSLAFILADDVDNASYKLTANGSWFAGTMMEDLIRLQKNV